MDPVFFVSHSLKSLALKLSAQRANANFFEPEIIVTPHLAMREWLQFELCKNSESQAICGLQFFTVNELTFKMLHPRRVPTRCEISAALWTALKRESIVHELTGAFEEYCLYGAPEEHKQLFCEMFAKHGWLTYPELAQCAALPNLARVHLFGIDFLPPAIHSLFLKLPKLSVYQFSPCAMFWEDLCSASQRKHIVKRWEQRNVSAGSLQMLGDMLRDAHPLLANWGKVGRKMLAQWGDVDPVEDYEQSGASALDCLKLDLLWQDRSQKPKDTSIQCVQTGSSLCREVRWLQQEIASLASQGVPFSEIRVYAPDIALYAPLAEFYFSSARILFRVEQPRHGPFAKALVQLFRCAQNPLELEELTILFEMAPFCRKANWEAGEISHFNSWNWDALIDRWLFLLPAQTEIFAASEIELFERARATFRMVQERFASWQLEKTLEEWAREIEEFVLAHLFVDEQLEADLLARDAFRKTLQTLRKTAVSFATETFPISWVADWFKHTPFGSEGSNVNAVRLATLELGAILPARFIFVLGMDEESFPRQSPVVTPATCSQGDFDRYLFLQLPFAAKERLVFSYGHLSKDDGKQVQPSLFVQELFDYLGLSYTTAPPLYIPSTISAPSLFTSPASLPTPASTPPSLQELTQFFAHPLRTYAKQILGIALPKEPESPWDEFAYSHFARAAELNSFLATETLKTANQPPGLFGELTSRDIAQKAEQFRASLRAWGVPFSSIRMGEGLPLIPDGVLHLGSDDIGAFLRKWPEMLHALSTTGTHRIHCLKTGKIREVKHPKEAFGALTELYLQCQNGPFCLHPEWADSLLRKQRDPVTSEVSDPFLRWALRRSPAYDIAHERALWNGALQVAFAPLIELFPVRSPGKLQ